MINISPITISKEDLKKAIIDTTNDIEINSKKYLNTRGIEKLRWCHALDNAQKKLKQLQHQQENYKIFQETNELEYLKKPVQQSNESRKPNRQKQQVTFVLPYKLQETSQQTDHETHSPLNDQYRPNTSYSQPSNTSYSQPSNTSYSQSSIENKYKKYIDNCVKYNKVLPHRL